MPQINRIRIINFSYNNDKRHILDQTFDFYRGENALVSLKNGGGKSVLVQLLMQPIIPMVCIQRRSIRDFFKKRRTPTYVMIEWNLDDKGGYLLTGIGMNARDTQVRENQDADFDVRYFTFTHQYRQANPFDIVHIPLISRDANQLIFLPYKEAARLIQEKSRDNKLQMAYFAQDDGEAYKNELSSFNISQDEWRNIIARINSDEGGVIEIFEKCKTSQQLMHEWIIKTVEKVIYKDREAHKKLELMLENLVDEMIRNEQFIHEKALLEEFMDMLGTFSTELEDLVKGFDEQKGLEELSTALHRYVGAAIERAQSKTEGNLKSIDDGRVALKAIQLEERSLEYYRWADEAAKRAESLRCSQDKLSQIEGQLKEASRNWDIQKAAELLEEIGELLKELAGLEEDLARIKGESDSIEKIESFEYSLKTGYESRLLSVKEKAVTIQSTIESLKKTISENREAEKSLDSHLQRQNHRKGVLDNGVDDFKKREEKAKSRIEFTISRNLFGEADANELQKISHRLENEQQNLIREKQEFGKKLSENRTRLSAIKEEKTEIQHQKELQQKTAEGYEREIKVYEAAEESLKTVFLRNDLDFERRFYHSENKRDLELRSKELQDNQFSFRREAEEITKTLDSLSHGTLHVPDDFASLLEEHDFNFETGENYLRKQPTDIRERLLENIPLLPYSFIMTQEEIERLKDFCPDHPVYQLIPLISYNGLNDVFLSSGSLVSAETGLSFVCLYNRKMLVAEDLEGYMAELAQDRENAREKAEHYTESVKTVHRDLEEFAAFKFEKDTLHKISRVYEDAVRKQANLQNYHDKLVHEEETLRDSINKIYFSINRLDNEINESKTIVAEFDEYLHANTVYEADLKELAQWNDSIEKISAELRGIRSAITSLIEKIRDYGDESKRLAVDETMCIQRLELYKNAKEAPLIEESIEVLEERLSTLRREINSTLERLNQDIQRKIKDKKRKEQELERLNLCLDDYAGVVFERTLLEKAENDVRNLTNSKSIAQSEAMQCEKSSVEANTHMTVALEEVKKLSQEPTSRQEIRMDFEKRKKEIQRFITEKDKENQAIQSEIKNNSKIMSEIESLLDVSKYAANREYTVKINFIEDHKTIVKDLKQMRVRNTGMERKLNSSYGRMVLEYRDKNEHIANIFKGLDPVKQQSEQDTDKYYYLYERAVTQKEVLGDLIRIYANQLANLERNKFDMVTQSGLHATRLYEEIEKISRDSAIKIEGKSRPVSMLQINLEKPEIDAKNNEKMRAYIESCISLVRDDMKKEKKKEDIRKSINKYMSSWELLNVISDLSRLVIKAYKVDINANNSEHKTWEQVMKENSGGERFVSFFAVLAALMSYTRLNSRAEDDFTRNRDTKVLIMDNPFGPISSEHLLKPLFEIAKKYNTQLICLTDLKQNSILNCFNLIYMLKIRNGTLGTNEYLEAEAQIREDADLEYDENLEKAIFRAGDFEQMRLM